VAPERTDDLIRWLCAFTVTTKCYLRHSPIKAGQLSGILTAAEIERMVNEATKVPLYCARRMRVAIARALLVVEEETAGVAGGGRRAGGQDGRRGGAGRFSGPGPFGGSVAVAGGAGGGAGGEGGGDRWAGLGSGWEGGTPKAERAEKGPRLPRSRPRRRLHPMFGNALMTGLTGQVDQLVGKLGAMERIRGTRLPIVHVSHMRTFLAMYLLSLPFVYSKYWAGPYNYALNLFQLNFSTSKNHFW
jgi:hypothetical protein